MDSVPTPVEDEPISAPYTAWHYLLIQTLEAFIDPSLLKILPFHKLGTLPIEADILLLLMEHDGAELARRFPEFDFMLRALRRYTMAKRKHKVVSTADLSLQCLYSYCERGLLEHFASEGLAFTEIEEGVLRGQVLAMPVYLISLVKLADRRPTELVNLLSARHRRFVLDTEQHGKRAALLRNLYYSVFKEVRKMLTDKKLQGLPGAHDLLTDLDELNQRVLASFTPEEHLKCLTLEQRAQGLTPEEREQLVRFLQTQRGG